MSILAMIERRLEMSKFKKKTVEAVDEFPEEVDEAPEVQVGSTRCLEWCFLPGISHIGQAGLLQCVLPQDHIEEHQIKIEILSPPAGVFTVNWTVGK